MQSSIVSEGFSIVYSTANRGAESLPLSPQPKARSSRAPLVTVVRAVQSEAVRSTHCSTAIPRIRIRVHNLSTLILQFDKKDEDGDH